MASNSLRERIILANKAIIEGVGIIQTVVRTMKSYDDLQNYANTQLPLCAIVGGLPEPTNHVSRQSGQVDQCYSELKNTLYVYFMEENNETKDEKVSSIADDLWTALYADPTRGGLCIDTEVKINPNYETWDPYVAFEMVVIHHYKHTTGGI